NFQGGVVTSHHMLDDGQAQSGAAGGAGATVVGAVKALGEARQVPGVDADTVVGNAHHHTSRCAARADADIAALGVVTDGVHHQVGKGAVQFLVFAHNRQTWRAVQAQP